MRVIWSQLAFHQETSQTKAVPTQYGLKKTELILGKIYAKGKLKYNSENRNV